MGTSVGITTREVDAAGHLGRVLGMILNELLGLVGHFVLPVIMGLMLTMPMMMGCSGSLRGRGLILRTT